MKLNNLKGSLILITAALIWGLAFVAQSNAADLVAPFTFNALRSFIGAAALYIFYKITSKKEKKAFFPKEKQEKSLYLRAALICGICLAVSVNLQQFGIAFYPRQAASEARAGFLTALYVILVPIFSLFLGKKTGLAVWLGVAVALTGVYFLCGKGGFSGFYFADVLVFFCAISFSLHIIAVDRFVAITGGIKLSIMQFLVCGGLSLLFGIIFEWRQFSLHNIYEALPQILYLGIMSSGVAYTLQIVGQKYAEPTVASISMSLESVFAALGGWIISKNALNNDEIIGCVLVFAAIVLAQLPPIKKSKAKQYS